MALFANDACGQPIPWEHCCPWMYFDGKLLQSKLIRANREKAQLIDLCDGQVVHPQTPTCQQTWAGLRVSSCSEWTQKNRPTSPPDLSAGIPVSFAPLLTLYEPAPFLNLFRFLFCLMISSHRLLYMSQSWEHRPHIWVQITTSTTDIRLKRPSLVAILLCVVAVYSLKFLGWKNWRAPMLTYMQVFKLLTVFALFIHNLKTRNRDCDHSIWPPGHQAYFK